MRKINKNIKIFSVALVSALILATCADSYLGLEKIQTDTEPPGKVTVNEIVPKSGALEINFTLAKGDSDIAQIIASYMNKHGEKMEFAVSRYASSVLVEGFTGTNEVKVDVVCVDNSGNISEVTVVNESPLKSPIEIALESLEVSVAFGGVKINWENLTGNLLVIHTLTDDTMQVKGETVFIEDPSKRIYTRDTAVSKTFAYIRQYPDTEQKFGFLFSDKWGNSSDTLSDYFTPFREDVIEHEHINVLDWFDYQYTRGQKRDLDTDGIDPVTGIQKDGLFYAGGYGPHTLFDGNTSRGQFWCLRFSKTPDGGGDPEPWPISYATYDLEVDTRLSRMKLYWRPNNEYRGGSVKHFRLWGTDDNNADRSSKFPEGWFIVGEYVAKDAVDKNNITPEEWEFATGMDIDILDDNVNPDADATKNFRYLRIEMMESYGHNEWVYTWNEMFLWGQIKNKYYEE